MWKISSYAALAFAALAAAGPNLPPPIAVNAQIGRVHIPVTCKFLGLNQTFEVVASGGTVAYGVPGGDYYLTDTAGNITIPDNVLRLARLSGAATISMNTSIYLDATNASPARLLASNEIQTLVVPAAGSTDVRFPSGNGTLSPVGPFTIGTGSDPSRLLIGDVEVGITLISAEGKTIGSEISVVCPKPDTDIILGSVSVISEEEASTILGSDANAIPENGYVPDWPDVPLNNQYGFFRFPYNCDFGALGKQNVDLTIGGMLPTVLTPGESFNLSMGESFLRVPDSLVKEAQAFADVQTLHTAVMDFELYFSHTTPSRVNVALGRPLINNLDIATASTTEPPVIALPEYYRLNIGPLNATDDIGSAVSISPGNATAQVALQNSDGETLYGFTANCSPYAFLELIGVSIAEHLPYNYSLGTNESL